MLKYKILLFHSRGSLNGLRRSKVTQLRHGRVSCLLFTFDDMDTDDVPAQTFISSTTFGQQLPALSLAYYGIKRGSAGDARHTTIEYCMCNEGKATSCPVNAGYTVSCNRHELSFGMSSVSARKELYILYPFSSARVFVCSRCRHGTLSL